MFALWAATVGAQAEPGLPAGGGATRPVATRPSEDAAAAADRLLAEGRRLLDAEDPLGGLAVLREAHSLAPRRAAALVGIGRAHLLLGRPAIAIDYARSAQELAAHDDDAVGLEVRAMLRARQFDAALQRSTVAAARPEAGAETLAAHASALFRVQRNDEAAAVYRRVLALDPDHAEAHLRLGSGLTPPRRVSITADLQGAVEVLREGRPNAAAEALRGVLRDRPGHPIAHRLLGEALLYERTLDSMAATSAEFAALREAESAPEPKWNVEAFMPGFATLRGERRRIAVRALALFEDTLPKLVPIGGRHDLLLETERTTDHRARRSLRGRRTFDGRVWDDVRGIGGLRAATGIEALDEASYCGFDTLAHELAHQAHVYGFPRPMRARIRTLYREALAAGRCLDFYAASNEAEYFAQGVEAFISLGKRPTREATHGHTRFELMRVDPKLYALICEVVSHDPLGAERPAGERTRLLRSAIEVALRCGRPADAVEAARLLPDAAERAEQLARAERALDAARSH